MNAWGKMLARYTRFILVHQSIRTFEFLNPKVQKWLPCTAKRVRRDVLSDVSICNWPFSENDVATGGETAWCVSYLRRTDINLSKVLGCALGLTAATNKQAALSVHRQNSHLSPMLKPTPVSRITSDWQMTAEHFLLLHSLYTNHSPT